MSPLAFSRLLLIPLMLLAWPAAAADPAPPATELREQVNALAHGGVQERRKAARFFKDGDGPPLGVVLDLLRHIEREDDMETYRDLIRALGKTGLMEARPVIDRHMLSPDETLARAANEAFEDWLTCNGLLRDEEDLPLPPHPIYGRPPQLHPSAPAARSMQAQADSTSSPEQATHEQRAVYVPPPAGAPWAARDDALNVAPGFKTTTQLNSNLMLGGAALLGAGYLGGAAVGVRGMLGGDATFGYMFIPVAGPFITIARAQLFDPSCGSEDSCPLFFGVAEKTLGALLVVDGVIQVTGLTIFTIGLATGKTEVMRDSDNNTRLSFGLGSIQLEQSF